MVDKTGLQIIGWIFGGTTAAVFLVATLLVGNAIASAPIDDEARPAVAITAAQ